MSNPNEVTAPLSSTAGGAFSGVHDLVPGADGGRSAVGGNANTSPQPHFESAAKHAAEFKP